MALRLRMPVCTTVILIFTVVAASLFVAKRVAVLREAACFDRLHAEINELSDFIERRCRGDREQLEIIAKLIAGYNDLTDKHLWERLDTYTDVGMISRLELLLPGDVLLSGNGRKLDVSGRLSFAKEASARGSRQRAGTGYSEG